MKPEIKKRWIDALRSGEYKQGTNSLKRVWSTGECQFCCLGVLTDLYLIETGKSWNSSPDNRIANYIDLGVIPKEVMDWSGLESIYGFKDLGLIEMNDSEKKPFKEIAGIIEGYDGN